MNRRALAWVSAAVVAIVGVSWWLSAEVAAPLPAPVAVAEPVAPPPPVAIAALPALTPGPASVDTSVEEADAGRLAEVEIEVYDDGVRQVGIRVELEGPGGRREGRPIDIMGVARFTLTEGAWRITSLARRYARVVHDGGRDFDEREALALARTTPLQVQAPLTRVRVALVPRRTVRGRVLDAKGNPVIGARVRSTELWKDAWAMWPEGRLSPVYSDSLGRFEFEVQTETVELQARQGRSRSLPRTVNAPGERDLVLEPWTFLRANLIGPGSGPGCVRVQRRGDFVTEHSSVDPIEVPVGHLEMLTRRLVRGRVFSARGEADVPDEGAAVDLYLKPSQPIHGRLVDVAGHSVPGVTVGVAEVDVTRPTDGGVIWNNSSASDSAGQFALSPASLDCADPLYRLVVSGAWRTTRQVLVRLDDAPLEVVIEPVP